jgi:hypothetical protein
MKAKIINAPNPIIFDGRPKIFLAGSIEMGKAVDWQMELINHISDLDCVIFNPRLPDWDASWEQKIENKQFNEQVNWELNALQAADVIAMYFAPGTQSPISLLEFGLYANSHKLIVCCPEGFWRKGNVDIVVKKYSIEHDNNFNSFKDKIKKYIPNSID